MALIWCDNCVLERNNFSVNGTNCILNYCRCIRLSSQHWWNSVKSYLHVFVACCWWLNWCRALFIAFDFSIRMRRLANYEPLHYLFGIRHEIAFMCQCQWQCKYLFNFSEQRAAITKLWNVQIYILPRGGAQLYEYIMNVFCILVATNFKRIFHFFLSFSE